jgi:hypothetical protein
LAAGVVARGGVVPPGRTSALTALDRPDGYNAAAGAGTAPPGLTEGRCARPGVTGGAALSTGAAAASWAGTRTLFAATGRPPASVAPLTAVIAPGILLFAYVEGGTRGRSRALTPYG